MKAAVKPTFTDPVLQERLAKYLVQRCEFIKHLYFKRFVKPVPERVIAIEQLFHKIEANKGARRAARLTRNDTQL